MTSKKPTGFLHVDVDGLWAVRACYQREENDTFQDDPCWREGVTLLSNLFQKYGIPASFFIVGRDLEVDEKRREARKLLHHGFELGNHTYNHFLGLTLKPSGYILREIQETDRALRSFGAVPNGFRSPGYDVDGRVLRIARRCGYQYDCSLLPTYWAPVLRIMDAFISRKWNSKKRQFGRFSYGKAPRQPYFPRPHKIRKPLRMPETRDILEIPVGVTRGKRLPLTASALFRLNRREKYEVFERLGEKKLPVLLLLHAIDGTDCRQPIVFDNRRPSLAGFQLSAREKEKHLQEILEAFSDNFHVTLSGDYARDALQGDAVPGLLY